MLRLHRLIPILVICLVAQMNSTIGLERRSLLFPPTSPTRVQFIAGIGIPVEDLSYEAVTSGYVLKAEYFLPTVAQELHKNYLRPQSIHRRDANETNYADDTSDASAGPIIRIPPGVELYRWILYKGVETVLDRGGFPGRACMLRTICEHAVLPFDTDSGLLAEVLHVILTPSTSIERLTKPSDQDYKTAELYGRNGIDCAEKYRTCEISPIDLFSTVVEVMQEG